MSEIPRRVATQGGEMSYHAIAAREIFGASVDIQDCADFGEVIRETRTEGPGGMGVIAVKTAKGPVQRSVAEIVNEAPDALSDVVGRVDLDVSLVLVSPVDLELEDLTKPAMPYRVCVHAHREAWRQSEESVISLLDKATFIGSKDNIQAVADIMDRPDHLAITPAHAVEPLGVHQIGEGQLNPLGSKTRFYGLQLDPRYQLIVPDEEKTVKRVVLGVTHPSYEGAINEVLELCEEEGVQPMDFIAYPTNGSGPHGGIFEIAGDLPRDTYSPNLKKLCARIARIKDPQGVRRRFTTRILGSLDWYPEAPMDLKVFADRYGEEPDSDRPLVVREAEPEATPDRQELTV